LDKTPQSALSCAPQKPDRQSNRRKISGLTVAPF
jgi:hypothetical protein